MTDTPCIPAGVPGRRNPDRTGVSAKFLATTESGLLTSAADVMVVFHKIYVSNQLFSTHGGFLPCFCDVAFSGLGTSGLLSVSGYDLSAKLNKALDQIILYCCCFFLWLEYYDVVITN